MNYINKIEFKDGSRHESDHITKDVKIARSEFDTWKHEYKGLIKSIIMYCDGSCVKVEFSI